MKPIDIFSLLQTETILSAEIAHGRDRTIPVDIQYWFVQGARECLVTDVEVKTMFSPLGYQEEVVEAIKADCQARGAVATFESSAIEIVKLKTEK